MTNGADDDRDHAKASQLISKAHHAMSRGKLEEAHTLVMKALQLDRSNSRALTMAMEINRRLDTRKKGRASEPTPPLSAPPPPQEDEDPGPKRAKLFHWKDYSDPVRREEMMMGASAGMDLIIEGQIFKDEAAPSTEEVMRMMPISYDAFYGGFKELREVQKLSARPILEGADVFISASTSSGKTEAAMAPLLQRAIKENWKRPSIVYVAPTKALANNIVLRLERPCRALGRRVALYTGDNHDFRPSNPADIVITVPETIDSLMRLGNDYPFFELRALVVDELHLMDGNYRGDQLRVLMQRMKRIEENSGRTGRNVQMVGLSATVADPGTLWARYAEAGRSHIVHVGGRKGLKCRFLSSRQEIAEDVSKRSLAKGIIFCNTRAEVERAAAEYQRRLGGDLVRAHHGSLSKETREDAEEWLMGVPKGFVVSTMTLEIGIDVGDIDVVIIDGCPWSASSLAQRIGRACRRKDDIEVIFRCTSEEDGVAEIKMLAAMIASNYETDEYEFDLSVAVQQVLSYCNSRSRIGSTSEDITAILGTFCAQADLQAILRELCKGGLLRLENGRYLPSLPEGINVFSNVPDANDIEVVEASSGRPVGKVAVPFEETFMLSGACWKVVGNTGGKLQAARTDVREYEPRFGKQRVRGAFFDYLPDKIKARYPEEGSKGPDRSSRP
ncbi:MAG: DEAD/DEAH box helicase [Methanomassiliicoccales archaeon]